MDKFDASVLGGEADLKKGSGCYMDTKCVSGERETV